MEKKVVYTSVMNQNITVAFDSVEIDEIGSYFYKDKSLILFLPIRKAFLVLDRSIEIGSDPLC